MNFFTLHHSIQYLKTISCFLHVYMCFAFFFQLILFFGKISRNFLGQTIQMPEITNRTSNDHFSLRNIGHRWHRLTVIVTNDGASFSRQKSQS